MCSTDRVPSVSLFLRCAIAAFVGDNKHILLFLSSNILPFFLFSFDTLSYHLVTVCCTPITVSYSTYWLPSPWASTGKVRKLAIFNRYLHDYPGKNTRCTCIICFKH